MAQRKEVWDKLPNGYSRVLVTHGHIYEDCALIYLRRTPCEHQFRQFQAKIDVLASDAMNAVPPSKRIFSVGDICLAKSAKDDRFHRAKVMEIEGSTYGVLYVDFGYEADLRIEDIVSAPQSIIEDQPFQALECTLFGMEKEGGTVWSEEQVEIMTDIFNTGTHFFAKPMAYYEMIDGTTDRRFEIVLINGFDSVMVNLSVIAKTTLSILNKSLLEKVKAELSDVNWQPNEWCRFNSPDMERPCLCTFRWNEVDTGDLLTLVDSMIMRKISPADKYKKKE